MRLPVALGFATLAAVSLTACPGGTSIDVNGNPPAPGGVLEFRQFASFTPRTLAAQLNSNATGQQILAAAGNPVCGTDVEYYQYATVGGKGEQTTASGAILAPTGGTGCSGARPILLYTHGTAVTKAYNLANLSDPTNEAWPESAMVAAFYAAQGYIVVASNYAGYDSSPLPYHPYLNAKQQSQDVIDALNAARTLLKAGLPSGVSDNGRLFITGYSQGGHVTMATYRAMQAANMVVTAAAPMSGPYALLALVDAVVTYSNPSLASTIYVPLIVNSFQNAYGNIYTSTSDIYSATYATGIDTLIPGQYTFTTLITSGKLPEFALFDSTTPGTGTEPGTGIPALDALLARPSQAANPIGYLGFGNPYLVNNSARIAYALDSAGPGGTPDGAVPTPTTLLPPAATPTNPLRAALKANDLRGFNPQSPTMLCGGMNDPEVYYQINTLIMKAIWTAAPPPGPVSYVDVDPTTNGDTANAGQIATTIGAIAAGVFASEPGATAAKVSSDVQSAIVGNAAFSAFFSAPGVANSPQGVMVIGIAGVAVQSVATDMENGVTLAATIGSDAGDAVISNYHFPLTQISCEVAAQKFFAAIP